MSLSKETLHAPTRIGLSLALALGSLSFVGTAEARYEPGVPNQVEAAADEIMNNIREQQAALGFMALGECNVDLRYCDLPSTMGENKDVVAMDKDNIREAIPPTEDGDEIKNIKTVNEGPITTAPAPVEVSDYSSQCEQYRPLLEQYDWPVDAAMKVMKEESDCIPTAVSDTNDHGLMQLHQRPIYDPAENIAVAYELYEDGRIGERNWSAWYAVCTPGDNPQPKYAGIHCQ